ncbi:DNA repair protein rhp54 [Cyphellophora attinorum]|uniref:DNA repair protein rhp54 n=1 Tax=Cyphellophora attinorum TaxID=1664694 RepID=A0A0N1H6S8_9EURO|nr:DNA repair protein rhp54 [Phialophora attinorum]KPI37133.1 DNA repair protein rhp54 [Phialophora attinorum]
MIRPRPSLGSNHDKENIPPAQSGRLSINSAAALDRLVKPFRCPGSSSGRRKTEEPPRKRRKVNYAEEGNGQDDASGGYSADGDGESIQLKDKFPVFKPKDKDTIFRARFAVPLINKDAYDPSRAAPSLGMRKGVPFQNKPLHDPSGEFSIVLYDPTIDDKPDPTAVVTTDPAVKTLDAPLMHKSLAEILGIKKEVEGERPNVPVVIDPRLAKTLRPHQVEGVKFLYRATTGLIDENAKGCIMQMRWVSARLCSALL